MRVKIVIYSLAAGCLLATGPQLLAQNTNATPTNMAPRIHAPQPGASGVPPALAAILSEEQQASFEKVNISVRQKLMELQPKYIAARKEVFEAGLSPKLDENLVHQKAMAAAQIYADTLELQAKIFSEIQPPLSAEQLEKIKGLESGPSTNPRILRREPPPQGATNHPQNGVPAKP